MPKADRLGALSFPLNVSSSNGNAQACLCHLHEAIEEYFLLLVTRLEICIRAFSCMSARKREANETATAVDLDIERPILDDYLEPIMGLQDANNLPRVKLA